MKFTILLLSFMSQICLAQSINWPGVNAAFLQGIGIATTSPTFGTVLTYNSTTSKWEPQAGGGGGGTPGGADTQVQFNNAGSFGGSANFIWTNGSNLLTVDGLNYPTVDGLANQPAVTDGSGNLSLSNTIANMNYIITTNGGVIGRPDSGSFNTGQRNTIVFSDNGIDEINTTTAGEPNGNGDGTLQINTRVLNLSPDGNGVASQIQIETGDGSNNYVALVAPATMSSSISFTLPSADGSSGNCLQTNGSGILSFSSCGGGGSSGASGLIQYSDGAGGFLSHTNFQFVPGVPNALYVPGSVFPITPGDLGDGNHAWTRIFATQMVDTSTLKTQIDLSDRLLYDAHTGNQPALDWQNRILLAADGTTAQINWAAPSAVVLGSGSGQITFLTNVNAPGPTDNVIFGSGDAGSASTSNLTGGVTLQTGVIGGTGDDTSSGSIVIETGTNSSSGANPQSGGMLIQTGDAGFSGIPGDIDIEGADVDIFTTLAAGNIGMLTQSVGGSDSSGEIDLSTGSAATGSSGNISIVVGSVSGGTRGVIYMDGHLQSHGTAPGVSACGTGSPSVAGNDVAGRISTGGGAVTSCLLTFNELWTNAPVCFLDDQTAALAMAGVATTSTLTITAGSSFGSATVGYHCISY